MIFFKKDRNYCRQKCANVYYRKMARISNWGGVGREELMALKLEIRARNMDLDFDSVYPCDQQL